MRQSGKTPITNTAITPIKESGIAPIDRKMNFIKIWFVNRQVAVGATLETVDVKGRSKGGVAAINLCGEIES